MSNFRMACATSSQATEPKLTMSNRCRTGPKMKAQRKPVVRGDSELAMKKPVVHLAETVSMDLAALPTEVHERRGNGLATATNLLRHDRLRAAVLFLFVTWGIGSVWSVIQGDHVWLLRAVVLILLGGVLALMSFRQPLTPIQLRAAEVFVFLLMAAAIAVLSWYAMAEALAGGDAVAFKMARKNHIIGVMILIFVYATFVPNSWRAATWIVVPLAVTPIAITRAFLATYSVRQQFQHDESFEAGWNLTILLIVAGLAIYGEYVLSTLRQEVFEARRLNQYQLGQLLGAGAIGEVYLAEHRLLKRPCAVKLIRPEKAGDKKTLADFEHEVRSTAQLSHPNIVDIYDYGHTDDGTFYYVMEHLRGLTLAELIERHAPLDEGRVIYLLRQVCYGLAEAHAVGLIHRDLAPDNIFAAQIGTRHDVAKILDFGLAQKIKSGSHDPRVAGVVAGTPLYMAPEQGRGDPTLDHRADLYTLGTVAYHLLTGHPPFDAGSVAAVIMAHAHEPVVPPTEIVRNLSPDLQQVVLRCLEKDPINRFRDAEQLGEALSNCASADEWDARQANVWWESLRRTMDVDPNCGVHNDTTPRYDDTLGDPSLESRAEDA